MTPVAGGLSLYTQDSFAAGSFQGPDTQRIPVNGFYAGVNGLVDVDEGVVYRRGGSAYKGSAAAASLKALWDLYLAGGQRTTLATSSTAYQLDVDDATPLSMGSFSLAQTPAAVVGGIGLFVQEGSANLLALGGSRHPASSYNTGSLTVTNGSPTVTGSGTLWSTSVVEPGTILLVQDVQTYMVAVAARVSNTQLTLTAPWQGPTMSSLYTLVGQWVLAVPLSVTSDLKVASVANRLMFGSGNRIGFSAILDPNRIDLLDYHILPGGGTVSGIVPLGGDALVFTTAGVYRIRNVAYDLTDAQGNVQQRMDQVNTDLILWHDNGIQTYKGAVIVPAVDDIYLYDGASTPLSIGTPIHKTYRSYVAAGYTLGLATVARGHYILPVLNGTTWVDTLVCNLATGAWTQMAGYSGSCISFTTRVASDATRTQQVFGVNGTRVVDATGWFTPAAGNKNEADGTTHPFTLVTRDYTLSTLKGFLKKARLWVEGVDAASDDPTVTLSYATGPAGSSFTSLGATSAESTGDAPLTPWTVNAGGKRIRFKISTTSPFASLRIKALDLFSRPRGRQ